MSISEVFNFDDDLYVFAVVALNEHVAKLCAVSCRTVGINGNTKTGNNFVWQRHKLHVTFFRRKLCQWGHLVNWFSGITVPCTTEPEMETTIMNRCNWCANRNKKSPLMRTTQLDSFRREIPILMQITCFMDVDCCLPKQRCRSTPQKWLSLNSLPFMRYHQKSVQEYRYLRTLRAPPEVSYSNLRLIPPNSADLKPYSDPPLLGYGSRVNITVKRCILLDFSSWYDVVPPARLIPHSRRHG